MMHSLMRAVVLVFGGLAAAAAAASAPPPFHFASALGNNMVLQSAPSQAVVWGFCAPGICRVTVGFTGRQLAASSGLWQGQQAWMVKLPATPASLLHKHTITATDGTSTANISGVLFGDVWVCSGQSNMGYPLASYPGCWNQSNVNCSWNPPITKGQPHPWPATQCKWGCTNDSTTEIAAMAQYEHLRLYINEGAYNGSLTPQPEQPNSGWAPPGHNNRDIFSGGFSAVCWFCECSGTRNPCSNPCTQWHNAPVCRACLSCT